MDWLCWPRFDSPSVFGALLDDRAGRWRISPSGSFDTDRQYLEDTNILRTRFRTKDGSLHLTDVMPVASERDKRAFLFPDHEILRVVECEQGELDVEMVFEPRPSYGQGAVRIKEAGKFGLRIDTESGLLVLRTDAPVQRFDEKTVTARAHLRAGDRLHFSLTYADEWPAILPPLGEWSRTCLERSAAWWKHWLSRMKYDGPAQAAVARSALALKLLVYAPSGAVVAAPSTSLPERVGGDLNWDYRFCWLRDASLTMRALWGLGFEAEAEAFVSWMLHATRLTRPELRILYDVHGNIPKTERTLDDFSGYYSSRPVRIGNAAADQLQLDVYGEVIDAAAHFVRRGGAFDRETQKMLGQFGEYVCRNWRNPDEGIWEPRSGKGHNTHSRVLCWTALDRLIELHSNGYLKGAPVKDFEANRQLIRRDVEENAWNDEMQSYASRLGGSELDASLLLLSWYGFHPAACERMKKTYARINQYLGTGDGLLYRYRTGDSPGEGAFGICSFWGAEYLALGGGTTEEAANLFERLCRQANDVGLFAEEIDPSTGNALGNFPQAFTHVGLINAAITLAHRLHGEKPLTRRIRAQSEQPPESEVHA